MQLWAIGVTLVALGGMVDLVWKKGTAMTPEHLQIFADTLLWALLGSVGIICFTVLAKSWIRNCARGRRTDAKEGP